MILDSTSWALVLQGGAILTSYSAGVLQYLARQDLFPSVVSASSGGILNAVYYLAGQADLLDKVWTTAVIGHVVDTRWLRTKGYVFDNEIMMQKIIQGKYFLDTDAIAQRGITLWASVLDAKTFNGSFIEISGNDIYDRILAAIAHPLGHPSPYKWNDKLWYDGGFYYPTGVEALWGMKLDTVVIVRTDNLARRRNTLELSPIERMYMRVPGARSRLWKMYERRLVEENETIREMAKQLNVITVSPSKSLHAKFVTQDTDKIRKNIEIGYKDAEYKLHFLLR